MAVEKFRQLAPGLGSIEAKLYLEVGRWWLCCPFLLCVLGGVSGLISRFPVTLIEPIRISSFQLPTPLFFLLPPPPLFVCCCCCFQDHDYDTDKALAAWKVDEDWEQVSFVCSSHEVRSRVQVC